MNIINEIKKLEKEVMPEIEFLVQQELNSILKREIEMKPIVLTPFSKFKRRKKTRVPKKSSYRIIITL